jgi:hypothetical protein
MLATLWTLFSALAKKEKTTAQNEKKAVMATPMETKTAERIIGIFPCLRAGMLKILLGIFYLINPLKSTANHVFFFLPVSA